MLHVRMRVLWRLSISWALTSAGDSNLVMAAGSGALLYLTVCDPINCRVQGSSVHRISQARILQCVAISFSRRSSWPRDWIQVSCTAGRFFTIWAIINRTNLFSTGANQSEWWSVSVHQSEQTQAVTNQPYNTSWRATFHVKGSKWAESLVEEVWVKLDWFTVTCEGKIFFLSI